MPPIRRALKEVVSMTVLHATFPQREASFLSDSRTILYMLHARFSGSPHTVLQFPQLVTGEVRRLSSSAMVAGHEIQ